MFTDRFDAGLQLAQKLQEYRNNPSVVVVAIPRGGIEVGYVIAKELQVPLEVLFAKKIGAPGYEELAVGAVTLDSITIDPLYKAINQEYIASEVERIRELLRTRTQQYYGKKKPLSLENRIVILTDDGVATGKTFLLALELIQKSKPKKIIAALPVASQDTFPVIAQKADEVICLLTPNTFYGVSQFYHNFEQVDDEQAIRLFIEANT